MNNILINNESITKTRTKQNLIEIRKRSIPKVKARSNSMSK